MSSLLSSLPRVTSPHIRTQSWGDVSQAFLVLHRESSGHFQNTPPANRDAPFLHIGLSYEIPCRKPGKPTAGKQNKLLTYPRRPCMAPTGDAGWAGPSWWLKDRAHSLERSCQTQQRSTEQQPGGEDRMWGAIDPRLWGADPQGQATQEHREREHPSARGQIIPLVLSLQRHAEGKPQNRMYGPSRFIHSRHFQGRGIWT